jgi:hypothetical protein
MSFENRCAERGPLVRACVVARCLFSGVRRILRCLVLKPRFSQGFRGLFESCPLRSKTLLSPGFFAFQASSFGFLALSEGTQLLKSSDHLRAIAMALPSKIGWRSSSRYYAHLS